MPTRIRGAVVPKPETLLPLGLFVQRGFLAPDTCARLAAWMRDAPGAPAEVFSEGGTGVVPDIRRAAEIVAPDALTGPINQALADLAAPLGQQFGHTLGAAEPVSLLRYPSGGYYRPHRDRGANAAADRVVSVVVFVNDCRDLGGYAGGALRFYGLLGAGRLADLGIDLEPEAGTLVAFPSDWLHEVAPVTAGERCTLVTWFPRLTDGASVTLLQP